MLNRKFTMTFKVIFNITLLCLLTAGSALAVTYNLRAATGTVVMPDGESVTIWGFADCGADSTCSSNPQATLPGPVLDVSSGDSLFIHLKNDLPEPVSFMVAGQSILPTPVGNSYTYEIGAYSSGSYDFSALRPGTYLYESSSNQAKQVQMGLYGALIVKDYPGITYDREHILLLSEIDPDWHSAVAAGQAYNAIYFNPRYWLINGRAYPDTKDILAKEGEKILMRYLNAGSEDHVIVIHGMEQMEVANDGHPSAYPQRTATVVMNPGQTQDLIIQPELLSLNLSSSYTLYDRRLDITNKDHFPGGMITAVRVLDSSMTGLSVLSSPATSATNGSGYTYDVLAIDADNPGGTVTYSLSSAPSGMTIDSNGRISWVPAVSSPGGIYPVTVIVSNGASSVEQTFDIHINSNPVMGVIADQAVTAASQFTLDAGALTTDVDGDLLTYSLSDPFLSMDINSSTGVISWTPSESQAGTYSVQVLVNDGHGGLASRAFQLTVNSNLAATPPPDPIVTPQPLYPVTISLIDSATLAAVSDYKFIVNSDNTPVVDPGAVPPCNPCPGTHNFDSYSPVAATGTVTAATPQNATVYLPEGRYLLTVLAGQFDPTNNVPDDLEMRNGGISRIDGKHFTLPSAAGSNIVVMMQANPLPLSQVTVQVFHDNRSMNAAWDIGLEGAPMRNGAADHFQVELHDNLGDVTTDAFGNPVCTQYDAVGNALPGTGGVCLTDDNGFISIKNLPPNKYEVRVVPPQGSGWVQTTTIEGTKAIDAWVQEGNSGLLPEEIGIQSYLIFHGFTRPCSFGNTTDDCTTNDIAGTGRISGKVHKLQPSRPPFINPEGPGEPVRYPWVGLNNLSGNLEMVTLVRGDAEGNFVIPDIPDGTYEVVMWDDPQDYIISIYTVTMPKLLYNPDGTVAGETRDFTLADARFGGLVIPDWYGRLNGTVFMDSNENGVQEAGEIGLPGLYVGVRHRDGSMLYATMTDGEGKYELREFFPFGHFMVSEVDYSRLGATGVNIVAADGQRALGQPPVEERTDPGPVLTMGVLQWEGESNTINWAKKPYPLFGNANAENDYSAPNGGISGSVWYATTRNEEEIRLAAADDWEPGVPLVTLNLYERIVDPNTRQTVMDPATGGALKGRLLGTVVTDHYSSSLPADCPVLDNSGTEITDPDCVELLSTWNQVRQTVYDGAYQFFYDCSDPDNPTRDDPGKLLDPDSGACIPLPAGTYLVEVVLPQDYLLLTENDRNVIDQGDAFEFSPLREVPDCVGPEYEVFDPTSPDFEEMVNDCSLKEVTVQPWANAASDFYMFTEVPVPARIVGFVNDNINLESNRARYWFGDKTGVPFIPVSVRDYKGKELARLYTDADGRFEVMLPSTHRVNVPTPSGVSPNIVLVYANDPGSAANPDPHFNTAYNTLVMPFGLFPGKAVFPDMALTPVNGFLANQKIECGPDTDAPQISLIPSPVTAPGSSFTIQGNGFGASPGRVTLRGLDLTVAAWSDTLIDVTIPPDFPEGPSQLLVTGANGKISTTGITMHVTGLTYQPNVVTVTNKIQDAIDAAPDGSIVLVPPAIYRENPIIWKPLTLQGFGPGTVIDGAFLDPVTSTIWQDKMVGLITDNTITALPGQPIENIHATLTVVAREGSSVGARIDGMTIQGARVGGGIHVNSYANNIEISNNVIMNNIGAFTGGISLGFPNHGDNLINAPHIHHNRIVHNGNGEQGFTGGIGIYTAVNAAMIDHNLICANGSMGAGGGIGHFGRNQGDTAYINHNDIMFNWAFTQGGGILIQGPPPANPVDPSPGSGPVTIEANLIQGNFANSDGGGIAILHVGNDRVDIVNNMIVNNITAEQGGAAVVQDAFNMTMINNTIAKNNSTSTSGTFVLNPGIPHSAGLLIHKNTIPFQNTLPAGSKTISDPSLFNNIFWDNKAYIWDPAGEVLMASRSFDLDVFLSADRLSRVRDNLFTSLPAPVDPAARNMFGADPLFAGSYDNLLTGIAVRAAGEIALNPLGIPVTVLYSPLARTGDYHIMPTSPALEYGEFGFTGTTVGSLISAPIADFDSETRPIDSCIDAGADERPVGAGETRICNTPLTAVINGPVTGNEGSPVAFDASNSSPANFIVSYTWNFGDGSPVETSASPQTTHTYPDNGSYTVTLTVTGNSGQSDAAAIMAEIANLPPVVDAGPDVITVNAGEPYSFSGTAADPGPVDTLLAIWDFGDGVIDTTNTMNPIHTYPYNPSLNQYTVTFMVSDDDGKSASDTITVNVNTPPVISSTPVARLVSGTGEYLYQVVALDLDGDILTYALTTAPDWLTISTNGLISGTPPDSTAGDYNIKVTVSDGHGGVATQEFTLSVVSDLIFADSFESGNLLAWSRRVNGGMGVSTSYAPAIGTVGMQLRLDGGTHYLADETPAGESTYNARFYFDPNGSNLSNIQTLFSGLNSSSQDLFRIQVRSGLLGSYQIRGQVRSNAGTYSSTNWITVSDDVHSIEISWKASTNFLSPDGSLYLYIDGVLRGSLFAVSNWLQQIEEVRLGVAGTTGALSGVEYIDDFVSTRISYVGPRLLDERFDGLLIDTARWKETDPTNFLTQLNREFWFSGNTTATRTGRLDSMFMVDGDFDIRTEFNLPAWSIPRLAAGVQHDGLIISSALNAGAPDANNRISISRKRTRTFDGYESTATVGGVSTNVNTAAGVRTGLFRFARTGTVVSAYRWNAAAGTWSLLHSAPLPAGPVIISLEGHISGGTAAIVMQQDTLKVTAGEVLP